MVDKDSRNAAYPNIMDRRFGRSIHSNIHIMSIPRITNEQKEKFVNGSPH